jgi:hypothetical protein
MSSWLRLSRDFCGLKDAKKIQEMGLMREQGGKASGLSGRLASGQYRLEAYANLNFRE